jgi:hypothetical protein
MVPVAPPVPREGNFFLKSSLHSFSAINPSIYYALLGKVRNGNR